jgi:cysteine desulfurase
VVRVTGNFGGQAPLSEVVRSAISAAFDAGWADPKKLSQASTRSRILESQALESIAAGLSLAVGQIEVVGEEELAPYLALSGFLSPEKRLTVGAIDRGKIRALTRNHVNHHIAPVDGQGRLDAESISRETLLSLQVANGETGIVQDLSALSARAECVVLDATTSGSRIALGKRWDAAVFSSSSWGGPQGIAIIGIRNSAQWRYPLPHIAPIRTPGGYSLPLLLASSVALENFKEDSLHLRSLNQHLRKTIVAAIPGTYCVGDVENSLPHLLTIILPDTISEMVVRDLDALGITVEAGSACSPVDLAPSHVLAAMGLPTEGAIRIRLRDSHSESDIDELVTALVKVRSDL